MLLFTILLAPSFFFLVFGRTSWGSILADPSQLPTDKQYDYIVVGAGPGGSVIASRLSEDPNTNVLLIEAGPSDHDVLDVQVPFFAGRLQPNTAWDWNYTTVPQTNLDNRVLNYVRGHGLGGSSSINYMAYSRGPKDDFDRYAATTGDKGWSWDALQPYFRKLEHLVPPVDGHNTTGQIDPTIHGTRGPVNFSLPGTSSPADSHILVTTQEDPNDFPFNIDMNSGDPLGVGWLQSTIGNGARTTASTAYVLPVAERPNFDVLVNTRVTKLVQTGKQGGKLVFLGVQFAQSPYSPIFSLNATKEIVLAAGAINTPQLLMLSGLGPSSHLSSLSIKTALNLPAVGQNLSDHPQLPNIYGVARPEYDVIDTVVRNATLLAALLEEWQERRQGRLTDGGTHFLGWFRIPEDDPLWRQAGCDSRERLEDPSAGPTSPHIELIFPPGFFSYTEPTPANGSFFTVLTVVVSPSSRGSVTLSSPCPFDSPSIDPAFLSTPFDVLAARYAVRTAARFLASPTWSSFITGQAASFAGVDLACDASVDAWVRAQTATIWHPTGTARMGRCEERAGGASVVDPDGLVKGIVGLRIVDASILPFIPAAHTQAVVYVVAERIADLIKSGKSSCGD